MKQTIIALALSVLASTAWSQSFTASGTCEVYFSPRGGATEAAVRHIEGAKEEIKLLAFYFTSKEITQAVERASARGVKVQIVLDRSQPTARGNKIKELLDAGVEVRIDGKHPIMHNKVILIDRKTVLTGSFNFSASAENRNAENMLICTNAEQAKLYGENWQYLWDIARLPQDAPAPLKR